LFLSFCIHQMVNTRNGNYHNGDQDQAGGSNQGLPNWNRRAPRNQAPQNQGNQAPPVMDPMQMMAMQTQILQGIAQVVGNMQQVPQQPPAAPAQDALRRFLSLKPPTFTYAEEPMDVDDWLATIESKLEVARCEGRDRVLFAAHQLQGAAKEWWTAYTTAHEDPQGIYWQEFRRSFRAHYVPSGEIKVKRLEFLALKQGAMTVREYVPSLLSFPAMLLGILIQMRRSRIVSIGV